MQLFWIFCKVLLCHVIFCYVVLHKAKVVHVLLDGHSISPPEGFLIRKGPGNCHFDFAQEILFVDYLQPQLMNKLPRR